MVLKDKLYNFNNLVIMILIILLMLMLYLGNYNLIEGNVNNNNDTPSQLMSNLDSLLSKNTDNIKVLTTNVPYTNDCSSMENINNDYLRYVKAVGGAEAPEAETIRHAYQAKATACSTTVNTNK